MRARKRGGLLRLLLKKAQAVQTDTDTLALCILVRGNLALGGAVPWIHSAGDARLPRCTGLVAHRHYWAHNDATGISPAQTKFSETSNAVRSREYPLHWEINLVLTGSNREPTTGKYSQLPVSSCLPMPETGLASIQPGHKWNNCFHVNSLDSRECCHCTQVNGAICDLCKYELNPKSGCTDWTKRKIGPSFFKVFITHHHYLKPLNPTLLLSLLSTWSCKCLRTKPVFYYSMLSFSLPIHLKQVPHSPATQITQCHQHLPQGAARVNEQHLTLNCKPFPLPAVCTGSRKLGTPTRDAPDCFLGATGNTCCQKQDSKLSIEPHG